MRLIGISGVIEYQWIRLYNLTMLEPITSWSDVAKFAERVQPAVSPFEAEDLGNFRISPYGLWERDFPFFEYSGPDGLEVRVSLEVLPGKPSTISKVAVRLGEEWWSVDSYEICRFTHHHGDLAYPQYRFRWSADESVPERIGQLNYAEYSPCMGRQVSFWYGRDGKEHRMLDNHFPETTPVPTTLVGQTEFFGRSFDQNIDVPSKTEEILRASQIDRFMLSVPKR